jgi:hypothetical protein
MLKEKSVLQKVSFFSWEGRGSPVTQAKAFLITCTFMVTDFIVVGVIKMIQMIFCVDIDCFIRRVT